MQNPQQNSVHQLSLYLYPSIILYINVRCQLRKALILSFKFTCCINIYIYRLSEIQKFFGVSLKKSILSTRV